MLKAPERARADLLNKGGTLTKVVIASYFEEEYVRHIREVDERLRVLYKEDLVPPPRWPGDHAGPEEWERTPEDEEAFLAMLREAEVLYDFPRGHVEDLGLPEHRQKRFFILRRSL